MVYKLSTCLKFIWTICCMPNYILYTLSTPKLPHYLFDYQRTFHISRLFKSNTSLEHLCEKGSHLPWNIFLALCLSHYLDQAGLVGILRGATDSFFGFLGFDAVCALAMDTKAGWPPWMWIFCCWCIWCRREMKKSWWTFLGKCLGEGFLSNMYICMKTFSYTVEYRYILVLYI